MNYVTNDLNCFLDIIMALYFKTESSLSNTSITGIIHKIHKDCVGELIAHAIGEIQASSHLKSRFGAFWLFYVGLPTIYGT